MSFFPLGGFLPPLFFFFPHLSYFFSLVKKGLGNSLFPPIPLKMATFLLFPVFFSPTWWAIGPGENHFTPLFVEKGTGRVSSPLSFFPFFPPSLRQKRKRFLDKLSFFFAVSLFSLFFFLFSLHLPAKVFTPPFSFFPPFHLPPPDLVRSRQSTVFSSLAGGTEFPLPFFSPPSGGIWFCPLITGESLLCFPPGYALLFTPL